MLGDVEYDDYDLVKVWNCSSGLLWVNSTSDRVRQVGLEKSFLEALVEYTRHLVKYNFSGLEKNLVGRSWLDTSPSGNGISCEGLHD